MKRSLMKEWKRILYICRQQIIVGHKPLFTNQVFPHVSKTIQEKRSPDLKNI
jgi:hypothetical protein